MFIELLPKLIRRSSAPANRKPRRSKPVAAAAGIDRGSGSWPGADRQTRSRNIALAHREISTRLYEIAQSGWETSLGVLGHDGADLPSKLVENRFLVGPGALFLYQQDSDSLEVPVRPPANRRARGNLLKREA